MASGAKGLETDDPYEFVAVSFPAEPGVDQDEQMARCVIEEYALMGFPPQRILRLFETEQYSGTHAVYRRRGKAFVEQLIAHVFGTGIQAEAN